MCMRVVKKLKNIDKWNSAIKYMVFYMIHAFLQSDWYDFIILDWFYLNDQNTLVRIRDDESIFVNIIILYNFNQIRLLFKLQTKH